MWQLWHSFPIWAFIPHRYCYSWKPGLVGIHLGADLILALAYFFVTGSIAYFTKKKWLNLHRETVILLVGAFFVFLGCGVVHLMEVITFWYPIYWISGFIKLLYGLWSSYVFIFLVIPLIPLAIDAPTPAQLQAASEEIRRLNECLKSENLRLSTELDITRRLQQMILPNESELAAIEGLDIAGFMEPANEVGGDYYDVLMSNGAVKISIGDVTGHGLESGVLMLMVQTAVRTLQEMNETDPIRFLDVLNRTIYSNIERMKSDRNLTLALIDYQWGQLCLSGQHEEMVIVRASGEVERIDTIDLGLPIGLDSEILNFIGQEKVYLNSGDIVVLYTDGVTEARNCRNVQYGLKQLGEIVKQHKHLSAAKIKEALIHDLRRHIGAQKVFDDITLLVLKQK
jgi:serine phosphatase RsbU (regulator of sigma subunit)